MRSSPSSRRMRGAGRVDDAEVAAQRGVGDLAESAGQLDAGRSAAHDDERQQGPAFLGVRAALGPLERRQDAPSHRRGVLDGLQARRVCLPFRMSKVVMARPGGDDQRVIRLAAVLEVYEPAVEVEADRLGEQDASVLLTLEHVAERRGDVGRREAAGRHLVEQRLEQVEVAAINQRHAHVGLAQRLRRVQPAEAAADDHHPMTRIHEAPSGCRRPPL